MKTKAFPDTHESTWYAHSIKVVYHMPILLKLVIIKKEHHRNKISICKYIKVFFIYINFHVFYVRLKTGLIDLFGFFY